MGGYGATHLALKFPETFGAFVSQAGSYYDMDTDFVKNWMRAIALVNPNDWGEFNRLHWRTQGPFANAAALSPNPDKPPFFLDKPFERVDGKIQVVPEVWEQFLDADVVHGIHEEINQ